MKGCVTTEDISVEEAVRRAKEGDGVVGMDYVKEVTPKEPYQWDPDGRLSRKWTIVKGDTEKAELDDSGQMFEKLAPVRHEFLVR